MESFSGLQSLYLFSPVGWLRISGSEEFISEVHFLEESEIEEVRSAPALLQRCGEQLEEYFSGRRKIFDLPLQQPGTPFQQKVWEELRQIPFGKTISYLDLAKRLGDEKVIRAAGMANGKNNIAIIVPCHRVIGSDGSLTGYAGGMHRKEFLLRHEGGWPPSGQQSLF